MTARADRPRGRDIARYRLAIAARDGYLESDGIYRVPCALCPGTINMGASANTPDGPTIEHVTAISLGGTNDLDNLRLAHRSCNLLRGNRDPRNVGAQSRAWL